jgi:hypothetical protein
LCIASLRCTTGDSFYISLRVKKVSMSATFWNALLEKTNDWDKDERYMATNDICNELSKDAKIDEVLERRICVAVLRQLGKVELGSHSPATL